uniref:NADH dehydrogenase [ubiquinone] 1 alpha subcomplex assembly factor 3 n=1 Tax=Globisporangium ultimum (strain ATCC 200006 / CBS 805.95 / DAOM BR144) TaxID=431595 RepID=K3X683_GLOUD
MLGLRRCLRAARPSAAAIQRRTINYGHDMHKEMLNGTAKISVTDYDEGGFVVNDVNMRGGVALYPEIAMLWKPKRFEEITKESMTVFTVANPPIEILVLGCGARIQFNLDPEIKQFLKENGIVVEYLDSVNACATFNILNAEDRKVAAAILPYDPEASKIV